MAKKLDTVKMKVKKSAYIRRALEEMGMDASPTEVAQKLQEQGIRVKPGDVSMQKVKLRRKGGTAATATTRRQRGSAPAAANGTQVSLDDVLAVRALAKRLGTENLKRLADALGD